MTDNPMIWTKSLSKSFDLGGGRTHWAVKDLDLAVGTGEVFGLLGPNGAGKTTTTKMLATLLGPTSGEAQVNGYDLVKRRTDARRSIGIVMGSDMIYRRLTGRDNLEFYGKLYRMKNLKRRISELADFFELTDRLDSIVETYSTGMRCKLALARGMIHDPPVLLLDEPTLGLDPDMSSRVRNLILQLKKGGKTLLLCTHYMKEAEDLCDRVGILSKGRLVAVGSTDQLRHSLHDDRTLVVSVDSKHVARAEDIFGVRAAPDSSLRIRFHNRKELQDILGRMGANDIEVDDIYVEEPSLEEIFLAVAES